MNPKKAIEITPFFHLTCNIVGKVSAMTHNECIIKAAKAVSTM